MGRIKSAPTPRNTALNDAISRAMPSVTSSIISDPVKNSASHMSESRSDRKATVAKPPSTLPMTRVNRERVLNKASPDQKVSSSTQVSNSVKRTSTRLSMHRAQETSPATEQVTEMSSPETFDSPPPPKRLKLTERERRSTRVRLSTQPLQAVTNTTQPSREPVRRSQRNLRSLQSDVTSHSATPSEVRDHVDPRLHMGKFPVEAPDQSMNEAGSPLGKEATVSAGAPEFAKQVYYGNGYETTDWKYLSSMQEHPSYIQLPVVAPRPPRPRLHPLQYNDPNIERYEYSDPTNFETRSASSIDSGYITGLMQAATTSSHNSIGPGSSSTSNKASPSPASYNDRLTSRPNSVAADSAENDTKPLPSKHKSSNGPNPRNVANTYPRKQPFKAQCHFPGYPSVSEPVPDNYTLWDICQNMPNHLREDLLLAFVQQKWSGNELSACLKEDAREVLNARPGKDKTMVFQKRLERIRKDLEAKDELDTLYDQPLYRQDGRPSWVKKGNAKRKQSGGQD